MTELKNKIEKQAKECVKCNKSDCIARPLMSYINEVGIDYFCYQFNNDKLPDSLCIEIIRINLYCHLKELEAITLLAELLDI